MKYPVQARIETRQGRTTMLVNDQPTTPLLYGLTQAPGARYTWEEVPARNIEIFWKSGMRLFQADLWMRDMISPDGKLDITLARRQIAGVLAAASGSAVMFRLHVNVPMQWCVDNPDECVGYAGTEPVKHVVWGIENPITTREQDRPMRASFYSKKWMEWCRKYLTQFCTELAATPEGDALFCIQIAYGVQGEWHQFGFFCYEPDTGKATTAAFRQWLKNRYQSNEKLAAAWSRPSLTLDQVEAPDEPSRERAHIGILRDPIKDKSVNDYFTFLHEGQVEAMSELCKIVKEVWPRPILTAVFYGYFYCLFGRDAAGGHLGYEQMLASPYIDALCMTPSYRLSARSMGGPGNGRGILEAVRRAGKLCFDEMDQPTMVTNNCSWENWGNTSISDDIAIMRRNILQSVTRGAGAWWYDFGMIVGTPSFEGMGTIGWWDEPRLLANVARLHEIVGSRIGKPYSRPADVLVIHDPWSFTNVVSAPHKKNIFGTMPVSDVDPITSLVTDLLFEAIQSSGVVYADALLSEIDTLDFSPYRMVIFATTPILNADQRATIRNRIAKEGRHVVMLGYCGWNDGNTLSAAGEADLLGSPVEAHKIQTAASSLTIDGVKETIDLNRPFEVPVFGDGGAGSEIIGRWADGSISAICRKQNDATWWAFSLPPCKPATVRALAKRAGCWIVNEHDDVTLLGDGLLVIHTMNGGNRILRLPNGKEIKTALPARSTMVFDADTGDLLMD